MKFPRHMKGAECLLKDNFDTLDNLWLNFTNDTELLGLLVDTTGMTDEEIMEAKDANVRRSAQDATLIVAEELPFMSVAFVESHSTTGNYLVNRESIEIEIWSTSYYQCSLVFKAIKRLLKEHYEDAQVIYSGNRSTPLAGCFCYAMRIKQFVES